MEKGKRSTGSSGEGLVEPEDTGQSEHADSEPDGALRPERARTTKGEETALILRRVIRTRKGRTITKSIIGGEPEVELWEETQEYDVKESHDDS